MPRDPVDPRRTQAFSKRVSGRQRIALRPQQAASKSSKKGQAMSVHRTGRRRKKRAVWVVRWKEGARHRSRQFASWSQAKTFQRHLDAQAQLEPPRPIRPEVLRALLWVGLRAEEMAALRWRDIDHDGLFIHRSRDGRSESKRGKVPGAVTRAALRGYLESADGES